MEQRAYPEPAPAAARGYPPISAYSLIGDCRTAALVASDASIDWCCLPFFDSPPALSRLIGAPTGGYVAITEADADISPTPVRQNYLPETAIVQTEIIVRDGRLLVTDFMPTEHLRRPQASDLLSCIVRQIKALEGECRFAVRLKIAPDYARALPAMMVENQGVVATDGEGAVILNFPDGAPTDARLEQAEQGPYVAILALQPGETLTLILSWAADSARAVETRRAFQQDWSRELEATLAFWQEWAAAVRYQGPYRAEVVRSALTLKLLTFAPTGAIVAAPTTSLPERIGSHRNWDYRYSWIRDGSFTAGSLASLGHTTEALDFVQWLAHRERRSESELRTMYSIFGNRQLPETELASLEGYMASAPVRIGNAAVEQLQLDIAGEWLDCIAPLYLHADAAQPPAWLCALIEAVVNFTCDHWREPDAGIWEVRSAMQHFVYSKVMCWAALDRGIALAERWAWPVDLAHWRRVRTQIHADVCAHGVDHQTGAFKVSYEAEGLDASALMIPLVGFLPPDDPRVTATTNEIARRLTDPQRLVYRYLRVDDGVGGEEGTFVMCSFWLAENLALQGRAAEATALFEKLLTHASPTGLLSEMIDSQTGALLGNYPQAFSHLGLIRAALALAQRGTP